MITVIDYGMGNLRSVTKAVEKFTVKVAISDDPSSIERSDGLIMPGDGAFGMAMENLSSRGWIAPILDFINNGGHFFGICLGFQLLFSRSDEFGSHRGLDIIPGAVVRFRAGDLKVPHMGWNTVELKHDSCYLSGVPSGSYFYFIHSYYPEVNDKSWVIGEVEYGEKFPCIVGKDNIIATQFHPEKSHTIGLKIIENFVRSAC
jgi:imidazole glycerol-phosphate synthase subunit HisH